MSGCSARAVWAGDCLERQAEWIVLTAWVIAGAGHRDLAGLVTAASGGDRASAGQLHRRRQVASSCPGVGRVRSSRTGDAFDSKRPQHRMMGRRPAVSELCRSHSLREVSQHPATRHESQYRCGASALAVPPSGRSGPRFPAGDARKGASQKPELPCTQLTQRFDGSMRK